MSYILEALKKSQQERDAIAAEHPPVFSQAINQNKSSKLTVLLLALFVSVVLLAVLLFFTLKTTSNNTEQVINIEPSQILAAEPMMLEQVVSPPDVMVLVEAKVSETEQQQSEPLALPEEIKQQTSAAVPAATVQERRLPPLDSLRKIPALIINSHIYSSLPNKRSVTINNRSQREGDYLSSDVFIKEITAQGLVIEVDGWPLNISRQQGWQPIPEGS